MKLLSRIIFLAGLTQPLVLFSIAGTTWDGGGTDNNWSTSENWTPDGAPPTGQTVDLTFDGITRLTSVNNYTSFDDFHSITFAAAAGSFTLSGSAIDLFGKIENYSTNTQTISMDLAINGGQSGTGEFNPVNGDILINSANVFTNGNTLHVYGVNGKTVTFGASTVISQAGHFNVEQASNVIFLGNNTYSGTTNVLAGSLTVGNGGTSGALGSGTITVASGATLTYNRSDAVTLSQTLNIGGTLVKNGTGALTLSGAQTGITGSVTINDGRITMGANNSLGTAPVTLNGGAVERNAAGQTVANAISIGAGGGTIWGRQVVDDYTIFSGQLTGSGPLTIQGLVGLNNAANSYAGNITVANTNTYLRLIGSERLGAASTVTLSGANASLRIDGTGVTQTLAALNGTGARVFTVGSGTYNIGSGTFSGYMDTGGGALSLVKQGSGTLTLNRVGGNGAAITGVTVNGGTLALVHTTDNFDQGYFTATTPITINTGGTVSATSLWTIKSTNVININGGTLNFSTPTNLNISDTNYMNNLTLQNGGTVSGTGGFRVGNTAGPTVTMNSSGNSTNTISTNLFFIKLSGITTYSMNVSDGSAAVDLAVSGNIYDSPSYTGMVLNKAGAGNLRLSGTNSYVGGTTLAAGRITGASDSAFGTGLITVGTSTNDVALYLGNRADISNPITVSAAGSGLVTIGADNSGSGANASTLLGLLTFNRPVTLSGEVSSDRFAIDGQITGNVGTLTVSGGSRTTFGNTLNNFAGSIVISGAGTILQASVGTASEVIPNTANIQINAGAEFWLASLGGQTETIAGLNGTGTVRSFNLSSLGGTRTLAVGSSDANGSFDGVIANGADPVAVRKIGLGLQSLQGASTFTGPTTVNGGTLQIGGTTGSLTTTSGINIDGGTLLVSSSAANRIGDSSSFSFGSAAGSRLTLSGNITETVGPLSLSASSTGIIDLGSGSAIWSFANSSAQTWGGVLQIWNWDGNVNVGGGTDQLFFGNSSSGLTLTQASQVEFFSNAGTNSLGTGILLSTGELVPVPEPSALLALGGMALVIFQRESRRRKPNVRA